MRIDVVSIFPDYLAPLQLSLVGKAVRTGVVDLAVHDLRTWTHDRHRTVDDTPYGGGAGMVMRPEPWGEALDALTAGDPGDEPARLIVFSPAGRRFDQAMAQELAAEPHLIMACGRYEGIDARVAEDAARRLRVDEVSIGDYVLNGGEAAALVVVEAVVRLLPGVIGNPDSLTEESHAPDHDGLLEYPLYTKPPSWRGLEVPPVLFSGHHGQIAAWRREAAVSRTRQRRPDLLPEHLAEPVLGPGRPTDAGELLTLQRAAYVSEARLNGMDIPPLLETLSEVTTALVEQTVLVARSGHRLVGAVRGQRDVDGAWLIGRLVVAPDHQGRGLGRRLLAAMEALVPPDAERIRLWTGAASQRNIVLYRRAGYQVEEERIDAYGVPVVIMAKPV